MPALPLQPATPLQPSATPPVGAAAADGEAAPEGRKEGPRERIPIEELGYWRVGFVFALLGAVLLWILATIKFALDGSLPARLALWGLLPEAYAAISVRAIVALLRLKSHASTPVIILRNCVTNSGAVELADAVRKYGKKADLQAIELPHNPQLGEEGVRALAAVAQMEGSTLQEFDFSYNPQLSEFVVAALRPLLGKASKVNSLRLADCGLGVADVQSLADAASHSALRLLDLSCNALTGGGEALAAVLEAPVLEELIVTCCGLQPADVGTLAEQLPYTSLKSLQLGGNRFGADGLNALVAHLPKCQIDELGLEGNELAAGDLAALGEAWVKRPFSRVWLRGNRMTPQEVAAFVNTLRSMQV